METNQRDVATRVVAELKRHGHIAVFAGGCVRDEILGLEPSDYDVATSALPDEVESIFERTLPVGKAFGIIVVVIDGQTIEVATLRADGQYGDGRRPDSVRFVTSLAEDARRREFTMNAMFKDPTTGEIFDFFGGQKDLADGIIRAVGNAEERIDEDRLRMLRAVRFASRYGFEIDPALRSAICKLAPELHRGPKGLAWERISKEFRGILTSANPVVGLDFMMEFGLMAEVIPELLETDSPLGDQDPVWHPEGNTWAHSRFVVQNLAGSSFELILAGLLHDVGKPRTQEKHECGRITNYGHAEVGAEMARDITRRLKLSNESSHRIVELVRLHMKMHTVRGMRQSKLVALLERDDIHDLIALQDADSRGKGPFCDGNPYTQKDFLLGKLEELSRIDQESQRLGAAPLVNGFILIELGFKPGPTFKVILEEAMAAQREGVFSTGEAARGWVIEQYVA